MYDFKGVANAVAGASEIIKGRTKIKTDDVIRRFPDGLTILEFDILNSKDKRTGEPTTFGACAIAEDPNIYFNASSLLTKILIEFVNGHDGDIKATSDELKAAGGLKVRIFESRTQDGNRFNNVEIL